MSEDNTTTCIYVINDTKKEFFIVPINSSFEETDSEDIKSIDPTTRLFLRAFEVSFNKSKDNNWNYSTDTIKKLNSDQFNLNEYQSKGYALK